MQDGLSEFLPHFSTSSTPSLHPQNAGYPPLPSNLTQHCDNPKCPSKFPIGFWKEQWVAPSDNHRAKL